MSKGKGNQEEEESATFDLRRGPWTLEEDNLLIHYITCNGEGRWNTLAKSAGLKRTGKSCRLRWLNYLKPDIKRGNLTPQEQLLILELHSKWGNRWSKIAQNLPGRTDNEIKNYWRTRVQKQARQLNVDSNSKKFLEAIRRYWMPRLIEKAEQNSSISSSSSNISSISTATDNPPLLLANEAPFPPSSSQNLMENSHKSSSDLGGMAMQIDNSQSSPVQFPCGSPMDECYRVDMTRYECDDAEVFRAMESDQDISTFSSQCQISDADWFKDEIPETSFWNMDELWHFRKSEVGI